MKSLVAFLAGAAVLALVGVVSLTASRLDRDIAESDRQFAVQNYDRVDASFDTVERYYGYASRLPWIGAGPVNRVRARRAAAQYWQSDYGQFVPEEAEPVSAVAPDNVELQLLVANALYRGGRAQAADKESTLAAIDVAMNAYLTVLRNSPGLEDAAYNYEYLVRLRDQVDRGRARPGSEAGEESPNGRGGAPAPEQGNADEFKIYIPLESEELQEGGGAAGKAAPTERKG